MSRALLAQWWTNCTAHWRRERVIEATEGHEAGLVEIAVCPNSGDVVFASVQHSTGRAVLTSMGQADADYLAEKLREAAAKSRQTRGLN